MKTLAKGLLILLFALGAQAENFNFVPANTEAQKAFLHDLQRSNFRDALLTFSDAYNSTAFANSPTGYALYSYLLYRNDMSYLALEHLFILSNPELIEKPMRSLLRDSFTPSHPAWKIAQIRWTDAWKSIFPKVNVDQVSQIWKAALNAAIGNRPSVAESSLRSLLSTEQYLYTKDEIHLNLARVYFQEGKLNEALGEYRKISKRSDFWLESLEERAWTELRLRQPGKALGELQTLMIPALAPQVGPESYFLQAFIDLKVCDYPGVFNVIKTFKERMRSRISDMQALAKTGQSSKLETALTKLESGPLGWDELGLDSDGLPRYFPRDGVIKTEIVLRRAILHESKVAQNLQAQKPALYVGNLPAHEFNQTLTRAQSRLAVTKSRIYDRTRVLAQEDVHELSKIIQKMHIAEAEVIERIHTQQLADARAQGAQQAQNGDVIKFPYDGEIWVDELDHYNVKVKGCPGGMTL